MHTPWADSVADFSAPAAASGHYFYVPPHLRSRAPAFDPPALASASVGPRWGPAASRFFGGPRSTGGWNSRTIGWGGSSIAYELNPFANDEEPSAEPAFDADNIGINFDTYEDIPVEAHGQDVPPSVNTFAISISATLWMRT